MVVKCCRLKLLISGLFSKIELTRFHGQSLVFSSSTLLCEILHCVLPGRHAQKSGNSVFVVSTLFLLSPRISSSL